MSDADDHATRLACHLIVHGRVQGVSYRASAQIEASRLGLSGWVRNRRDGTVEALICGPVARVDAFLAWAGKGPRAARVDRLDVTPADAPDENAFPIRPTV